MLLALRTKIIMAAAAFAVLAAGAAYTIHLIRKNAEITMAKDAAESRIRVIKKAQEKQDEIEHLSDDDLRARLDRWMQP